MNPTNHRVDYGLWFFNSYKWAQIPVITLHNYDSKPTHIS